MSLVDPYHDRYFDKNTGQVVGVRYDGPVGNMRMTKTNLGLGGLNTKKDVASIMGDNPAFLDPSFRGAPISPQIMYEEGMGAPIVPPGENDPRYKRIPSPEKIFLETFYNKLFD